ncbi:MAG: hypothetical protein ACI4MN_01990 [Candidatus Coproplasma sp.]
MKKSIVILIVQAAIMYLIQIPFYICLILAKVPNVDFNVCWTLILVGLCLYAALIPVVIVSLAFAALNLMMDCRSPAKTTLIVKLALIPWYVFNIVVCVLLSAGFLNPFLMIAVPLLIVLEVVITYIIMAVSSLQIVFYTLRQIFKKRVVVTPMVIIGIVFSFIFVLDIVGSYLLNKELKRYGV